MSQWTANQELAGLSVAITGRLATMTHGAAAELVESHGGQYVQSVSRRTDLLVTGQEGWPLGSDGLPTRRLQRAHALLTEGYAIEIIGEDAFLTRLGLLDQQASIHRRYTMVQLSRLLGVSRLRMKTWMRIGLIEPVEMVHRLEYFDYQQVTTARMLENLVKNGLTPQKIRQGVERLRVWLPGANHTLVQIASLESEGAFLVRLRDGTLAEPTGQLRFDFLDEVEPDAPAIAGRRRRSADEAFGAAMESEEQGDYQSAAEAYSEAVAADGYDPVLHFNLGNVLYQLNELSEATDHFQQATQLDPMYVEAWNNLGSLLAERGEHRQATTAFRRALRIVPYYADAHYNLANTLLTLGEVTRARWHWHEYLKLEPRSALADEVRERIQKLINTGDA